MYRALPPLCPSTLNSCYKSGLKSTSPSRTSATSQLASDLNVQQRAALMAPLQTRPLAVLLAKHFALGATGMGHPCVQQVCTCVLLHLLRSTRMYLNARSIPGVCAWCLPCGARLISPVNCAPTRAEIVCYGYVQQRSALMVQLRTWPPAQPSAHPLALAATGTVYPRVQQVHDSV